jgi:Na+/pantothenate symporter
MFESLPQFVAVVLTVCLPPKLQLSSSIIPFLGLSPLKGRAKGMFYVVISPATYSTVTKLIFKKSLSTRHFKSVVPLYKLARPPY